MLNEELKNIIEDISKKGKMAFSDSATEEQIKSFEEKHNLKFPKKFKEWLLFADGGDFYLPAGAQFYGVAHKPIINVNYNDRPNESYIVIGALCTGDPILFQKGSEKICIYNHEENKIEEDEIYDDFFALIKDLYDYLGIGD